MYPWKGLINQSDYDMYNAHCLWNKIYQTICGIGGWLFVGTLFWTIFGKGYWGYPFASFMVMSIFYNMAKAQKLCISDLIIKVNNYNNEV